LATATCYARDHYRRAFSQFKRQKKQQIIVKSVRKAQ
jgi:hypothetical protein